MKNNFVLIFLSSICLFGISSCYRQINQNDFEGFSWNTSKANIESILGKPIHSNKFEQYNTITEYLYYDFDVNFGYNTLPYFAIIDNKLVGGGYMIAEGVSDDANFEYSYEKYNDIQNKFNMIYGGVNTGSIEIDNMLNMKKDIPNMNITALEELQELCPFWTYWTNNDVLIKLTLNYDKGYLITVDILGPKLVKEADIFLANEFEKYLNE